MHHANEKMRGIFNRRFRCRLAFGQGRNNKRLVPPAVIPRPRVGDFAVSFLPQLGFIAPSYHRKSRARHDRNIGAANNLKQPQRVRNFFVTPLISANHRRAQHFYLWRLGQDQQRLHIASAGAGEILVDDDLAALLSRGCRTRQRKGDASRHTHAGFMEFRCRSRKRD